MLASSGVMVFCDMYFQGSTVAPLRWMFMMAGILPTVRQSLWFP